MAEKDPNEHFLEKIANMLDLIQKNQSNPLQGREIPPEIQQDLDKLELMLKIYKDITLEAMAKSDISPEEIQKMSITNLPIEQQKFLKKANRLEMELVNLEAVYGTYRQAFEMKKKKPGKKGTSKKPGETRKKKFKRLSGGDKGWMPL